MRRGEQRVKCRSQSLRGLAGSGFNVRNLNVLTKKKPYLILGKCSIYGVSARS